MPRKKSLLETIFHSYLYEETWGCGGGGGGERVKENVHFFLMSAYVLFSCFTSSVFSGITFVIEKCVCWEVGRAGSSEGSCSLE